MDDKLSKRFKDPKRRPYLLISLFSVILILYFLVPFYKTVNGKDTALISGFASLAYLKDRMDFLYYASMMNILSIVFSFLLLVFSLLQVFFFKDMNRKITIDIILFYSLKTLSDILMLVFSYLTKTNVKPSLGAFVQIAFTVLFFALSLLLILDKKKQNF